MNDLNNIVQKLGFENESEFHKLISSVLFTSQVDVIRFKIWQTSDRTKEGLLKTKLIPEGELNGN
jgi:hypothetical protein